MLPKRRQRKTEIAAPNREFPGRTFPQFVRYVRPCCNEPGSARFWHPPDSWPEQAKTLLDPQHAVERIARLPYQSFRPVLVRMEVLERQIPLISGRFE